MIEHEFIVCADVDAIGRAAADAMQAAAQQAVAARGRFTLALSGGSTPRTLYRLLAAEYQRRIPWSSSEIYFGDERCVPPSHPDSNFAMARDALLSKISGLEPRTHRIVGEQGARSAAAAYDRVLRTAFPGDDPTTFDVLLLGVGTDGHTASLFPGSPALDEQVMWVVGSEAPPSASTRDRVTLTYPVLDRAIDTVILCAGPDKRPIVEHIREAGAAAAERYPIARVSARSRVRWLLDRAAAG